MMEQIKRESYKREVGEKARQKLQLDSWEMYRDSLQYIIKKVTDAMVVETSD